MKFRIKKLFVKYNWIIIPVIGLNIQFLRLYSYVMFLKSLICRYVISAYHNQL